jgi:hypothetical protein
MNITPPYTACYCEENIYRLVEQFAKQGEAGWMVVFISNPQRQIPLYSQKAGLLRNEMGFVVWDYHVILLHHGADGSMVYDSDSTLEWPVSADIYVQRTFRAFPSYPLFFRVIPGEDYLQYFSSDRSHMWKEGTWLAPPPSWPCIGQAPFTLQSYIDMTVSDTRLGRVINLEEFLRIFANFYW